MSISITLPCNGNIVAFGNFTEFMAGMYLFACTQADMQTLQAIARNAQGLTTVLAMMIMKI